MASNRILDVARQHLLLAKDSANKLRLFASPTTRCSHISSSKYKGRASSKLTAGGEDVVMVTVPQG
jgi:hypothetical protein